MTTTRAVTRLTAAAETTPRELYHLHLLERVDMVSDGSNLLADGTLWGHACTLGKRVQMGIEFDITPDWIRNFVRVFTTGYPQKVPVDYDHGTANGAADGSKPVPKAGDVLEMLAVLSVADMVEPIRQQIKKAGRTLEDEKNLGLWVRFRPTRKSLTMIQEREYTELSISFSEDMPDNVTGRGQGPALYSVALCNTPFLDDMISVAASRAAGSPRPDARPTGSTATPPIPSTSSTARHSMKNLTRLSALLGRPIEKDDDIADAVEQAVTSLTQQRDAARTEAAGLKSLSTALTEVVGTADPAQAAQKVRQLSVDLAAATQREKDAKKAGIKAQVDTTIKTFERKMPDVPTREAFAAMLTQELEQGVELAKSNTVKALTAMTGIKSAAPDVGTGEQTSAAAQGNAPTDDDAAEMRLRDRALELERSDETIKSLKDPAERFRRALSQARTEQRNGTHGGATAGAGASS